MEGRRKRGKEKEEKMEKLSRDWLERKHDPISEKVVFPS